MRARTSRDHRERFLTYLITFSCYGCHLHGNEAGSVDRNHNLPGSRLDDADPVRNAAERLRMAQAPYCMDEKRREAVLSALGRGAPRGTGAYWPHMFERITLMY